VAARLLRIGAASISDLLLGWSNDRRNVTRPLVRRFAIGRAAKADTSAVNQTRTPRRRLWDAHLWKARAVPIGQADGESWQAGERRLPAVLAISSESTLPRR